MFDDRAKIHVVAGRGGDGSIHFRREKHVPRGGPDGGEGGRGGDVVLVADADLRDLSSFRRRKWLEAGRGEPGSGGRRHGAAGADAEARVPVGTQVLDADGRLVADLAHPGARVLLAEGGGGGRGNAQFATARRQVPRFAETGLPGDAGDYELRLKLLADAAMVGLPNAGKSSLLARISNARPKVADYPFTTLAPVLGTVDAPDATRQLTVADVPGLIEGASEGVGLGHEFLAHLERARLLLHVIDASEGDADARWRTIDAELAAYGAGLDERPQAVVLNKIDLLQDPPFSVDDPRILRVFRVSAATGAGIEELRRTLFELCPAEGAAPEPAADEAPLVDFLVYRPQPVRRRYRIFRTDRGFRVVGRPPERDELEAALKAAGVRAGAEVEVGDEVLEWKQD
jgi:GTP-binding protein